MQHPRNQYFNLDPAGVTPIDVFAPVTYARGKDFYIDVFRILEDSGQFQGLTFYLSELSPPSLPRYGDDVVLVLVSDEHFCYRHYWPELRGVIRTYSRAPQCLDEVPPRSQLGVAAIAHYLHKQLGSKLSLLRAAKARRDLRVFQLEDRVLHMPLGCFFRFRPQVRPIAARGINFAFLGSVEYSPARRRWLHRVLEPPKLLSRGLMLQAVQGFVQQTGIQGTVRTTGDFEESIQDQAGYAAALQDCRISLCPRGSNPETYRFFESSAAGCVIVCEPLPDAWFYRDHPALVIRDWSELPAVLETLLSDEARLQRLSEQTRAFWERNLSERAVAARIAVFLQTRSRAAAEALHAGRGAG